MPGGRGLTVVGDDAQAIYGFRAATPRNILDFADAHPGTTVVRLAANHRSTPPIVAVANAVMAAAAPGHASGKVLVPARAGRPPPAAAHVLRRGRRRPPRSATAVLAHRDEGVDLRRQAVLFRAAWHADLLELELTRRNVPYVKYGGLRFLEAAHVKDLLALLRMLDNPWDELAWARALRLLDGVGPATAARLVAALGVRAQPDAGAASPAGAAARRRRPTCPPARRASLDSAPRRAGRLPRASAPAPAPQVERLRPSSSRSSGTATTAPTPAWRTSSRSRRPPAGYADAAPRCSPTSPSTRPSPPATWPARPALDEDWLTLSTVHSAKGGEWDVVHVLHLADGCFPSDMATGSVEELEEERRLLYVACTRARNVLELSWPLRYHHNRKHPTDRHGWAQPSRFLSADVRAACDEVDHWSAGHRARGGRPSLPVRQPRRSTPSSPTSGADEAWAARPRSVHAFEHDVDLGLPEMVHVHRHLDAAVAVGDDRQLVAARPGSLEVERPFGIGQGREVGHRCGRGGVHHPGPRQRPAVHVPHRASDHLMPSVT